MAPRRELLRRAAEHATTYLDGIDGRSVRASATADELRQRLRRPLPAEGEAPVEVLEALAGAAVAGTVATQGPRYFGFVVGGSLPVATATDWLVAAWDQNAGLHVLSPFNAVVEEVAAGWIRDVVSLPDAWSVGYVTGGQMANFTSLAAARHHVLQQAGWDVDANGLFGAPDIDVVVSEEAHYTIATSLRMLGLGGNRVRRVPTDSQGRMQLDALAGMLDQTTGPCIVCAQVGNVNTGAFDPVGSIAEATDQRGAWLHVDGAFGLWAAASPRLRHLVSGIERADSIATDGHKWLNVPYDCGLALCAHPEAHRSAMTLGAAYIVQTPDERDPHEYTPEESRRARAVPVYATLRTLGKEGLADLVDRACAQARSFARGLSEAGFEILNEVALNQVLVSFGDAQTTRRAIAALQDEGTCWCGGTEWKGKVAMRISVSSWATSDDDVQRSLEAMIRAGRAARAGA